MPEVIIKCPETGKPVRTGMVMDEQSFNTASLKDNVLIRCPACGKDHCWSKEDAFLKGK